MRRGKKDKHLSEKILVTSYYYGQKRKKTGVAAAGVAEVVAMT